MRNRLLVLLAVLNLAMGAVLLGTPRATAQTEVDKKGCCKRSVEGIWYCCADCCSFSSNCKLDQHCHDP